ncbi:MAG: class I SAM-dependent methyltransferase [Solirubrobacteraceae bacterium]
MSFRYQVLYRVGFTPWDQDHVPAELSSLVQGARALAPGRALDVGCGTGTQAVYLAKRGWTVTAVDAIDRALARARRRAQEKDVQVNWITGDVASLSTLGIGNGFNLIFDRGCFHDLSPVARNGYAQGVSELAAPGATLLLMAFAHRDRGVGPNGASEEEIQRRFGATWELVSVQSDSGPAPPGPMRRVPRIWYRLRRQ